MHTRRMALAAALLAGLVLFAGCGQPRTVRVTGKVTYNGAPVAEGRITFEDEDPRVPPAAGEIRDGRFDVRAQPGKKKVRIDASREVPGGKKDPAMGAVPRQAYIPERYNAQTELTTTVKPDGPNEFDYPLTGPK